MTICAWCGYLICNMESNHITHGICKGCKKEFLQNIEEYAKKKNTEDSEEYSIDSISSESDK